MKPDIKEVYPTIEVITDLCLSKYEELPKTGKPKDDEWTVLAGIVMSDDTHNESASIVALATGTKCLGADKMCPNGWKLNDSHAEVLARRSFMRFCYDQMFLLNAEKAEDIGECNSIFTWNDLNHCFELKPNLSFHFFSTRLPCGDACIPHEVVPENKEEEAKAEDEPVKKKIKCDDSIHTGAKIINSAEGADKMAQYSCALRLKPGKGVPTFSMSCSDKMARWNIMGVQGAMLYALMLQPIYFSTINVLSHDAEISNMERAIFQRFLPNIKPQDFVDMDNFNMQRPEIRIIRPTSQRFFKDMQTADKTKPAPASIIWCNLRDSTSRQLQISVDGKRQGVPAMRETHPQIALNIAKYHFFRSFLGLAVSHSGLHTRLDLPPFEILSYKNCKQSAKDYRKAWQHVKENLFGQWTHKLKDYEQFSNPDGATTSAAAAASTSGARIN